MTTKDRLIDSICSLSKDQGCTCMFSLEELNSFNMDKLAAIKAAIAVLPKRRPWKNKQGKKPGLKSYQKWKTLLEEHYGKLPIHELLIDKSGDMECT